MILFSIIILIVSCVVLVKSGTWLVKSLTNIARVLQWSEFLVTFCLIALATSLPELFVGLSSAFHGVPQLSFGNVIGANILNLTLGMAVTVLIAGGLSLKSQIVRRTSFYSALIVSLPLLLMLDGYVSRTDGLVLLIVLAFYLRKIFRKKERFKKTFNNQTRTWAGFRLFLKDIALLLAGISLLLLSAEGVVRSASFLTSQIGFPLILSGILFVSLGTVLPEITFGVRAAMSNHGDMVLGNFMGTVVLNSTLILGLVALICPLEIESFSPYFIGILFTLIATLSFVVFTRTGEKLNKKEAFILLGIYILFVAFQLIMR